VAAGAAPNADFRADPLVAPFIISSQWGTLKVTLGDNPAPVAEVPLWRWKWGRSGVLVEPTHPPRGSNKVG
jgi:hypothetical protein